MLARFLWPAQRALRRRPLAVTAAGIAGVVGLVAAVLPAACREDAFAAMVALALALAATRDAAVAIAIAGSALAGAAACALAGDAGSAPFVIAGAIAALLPLGWAIAGMRSPDGLAGAITRGTGFAGFSVQLAAAGLVAGGWAPCIGLAVAAALGIAWVPAATGWRRLEPPAHAGQPRALAPERVPPPRDVIIARVALAVLAIMGWRQDWHLAGWVAIGASLMILIWTSILGRIVIATAVVAGGIVAAIACDPGQAEAALAPQRMGAVALGQALPLVAWWSRAHGRAPSLWLVVLVASTLGLVLAPFGLALPALAAGVAGWVALLAGERSATRPAPPLRRVRRAAADLPPYWRYYLRGKLALDPLYRAIAADATPWGRVLDAGCGPGLVAALAASRPDVTAYCGIDLDEDKLMVARRLLMRCGRPLDDRWQLLHGSLPFPQPLPRRFDTVLLLDVLHYWPPERQGALLAQLRGALETGGRMWLREGLAEADGSAGRVGLWETFTTLFGLNPTTGSLCFPTRDALERLLAEIGFRVAECTENGAENRLFLCIAEERPASGVRRPASETDCPG